MRPLAIALALVLRRGRPGGDAGAAVVAGPVRGAGRAGAARLALTEVKSAARAGRPGAGAARARRPRRRCRAHCRVDAVIDRRTGVDGKRYGIGFAVALPDDWNGRLLMQGGGGLNGRVAPPVGATAAGDTPALARGFAVVTTDTGHEGAVFDACFMRDQQAALDFAYVAVGRVALAAKAVVARFYGRPAAQAYFTGCSTGGREGMLMTQRYPGYFDGIIAGAPAMRTGHSNLAVRAMRVAFNRLAPRDAAGQAAARAGVLRRRSQGRRPVACSPRATPTTALKDGLIFDTRGCRFSPAALACKGPKADGCLSAPQVAAIERAFAGPRDSKGRQVYPRFLYDTGIVTTGPGHSRAS